MVEYPSKHVEHEVSETLIQDLSKNISEDKDRSFSDIDEYKRKSLSLSFNGKRSTVKEEDKRKSVTDQNYFSDERPKSTE